MSLLLKLVSFWHQPKIAYFVKSFIIYYYYYYSDLYSWQFFAGVFFAAKHKPLQRSATYKIKKRESFLGYNDCYGNAPSCHCPPPFHHVFAGNESSISDGLLRVQPKTQNPWINEAMHISHCAARPQTARQSMMLLLLLAKVDFVVYWIRHEPLCKIFKGTT